MGYQKFHDQSQSGEFTPHQMWIEKKKNFGTGIEIK